MAVTPGTRIGPYEIVSMLGAGGMGEVYRATDTRLGRDVAVKVTTGVFSARFEREARAVAALNHRNICTLHDVGANYLVMEFIDGETLAERIQRGPLPIADVLMVSLQIAEALEAAHEKGIVHRDLKPSNVMIQPDGSVKVLDFGLATGTDLKTSALSNSPTFAARGTEPGVVLGTAAYMSPEQARGTNVDGRADIWAFGCVVFEMATGRRVFSGETFTDVLAALMTVEPDWNLLPHDTPPALRLLLRRCLRKDRSDRLHAIADARIEIQDILQQGQQDAGLADDGKRRWRSSSLIPWAITMVLVGVLAWIVIGTKRNTTGLPARSPIRVELNLPPRVDLWEPFGIGAVVAFAPDGSSVAFIGAVAGDRQVYIRRLNQFDATPVPGTRGASGVFFSPDGHQLGVVMITQVLQKISLDNGLIVPLARNVDVNAGAAWGADNKITFGRGGVLWQISASTGPETQLTKLDVHRKQHSHRWPTPVGGGQVILFAVISATTPAEFRIDGLSTTTPQRRVVIESGSFPIYASSGHLIYAQDRKLFAIQLSSDGLHTVGMAARILDDVRMTTTGTPTLAVSASGAVAYTAGAAASRLVRVSRRGEETLIPGEPRRYLYPRLARDGHRIVVVIDGDLWIDDTVRGLTRLTSNAYEDNSFPIWTPDGTQVVFRTLSGLQIIEADGSGRSRRLRNTSASDYPTGFSSDGTTLLFMRVSEITGGDIYTLSLRADADPKPILATNAYEAGGQLSPNGRHLLYVSNECGEFQVFVQPLSRSGHRQLVAQRGKYARWGPDGREIFFRDGYRMMAVDVSESEDDLTILTQRQVFEAPYEFGSGQTMPNYDVSGDGQNFVMVKTESGEARLNVVLNWFDELKRLVPVQ